MSKTGVIKTLALLSAAYMKDLPDQTIEMYVAGLADVDDDLLIGSVGDLVVKSKYFPTVAEVRSAAVFRALPDGIPPTAIQAWNEVVHKASTVGIVEVQLPSCDICGNSRWIKVDEVGDRWGPCVCRDKVERFPKPQFSHMMISAVLDAIGGYNRITQMSDRTLAQTRTLFTHCYDEMVSTLVTRRLTTGMPVIPSTVRGELT